MKEFLKVSIEMLSLVSVTLWEHFCIFNIQGLRKKYYLKRVFIETSLLPSESSGDEHARSKARAPAHPQEGERLGCGESQGPRMSPFQG